MAEFDCTTLGLFLPRQVAKLPGLWIPTATNKLNITFSLASSHKYVAARNLFPVYHTIGRGVNLSRTITHRLHLVQSWDSTKIAFSFQILPLFQFLTNKTDSLAQMLTFSQSADALVTKLASGSITFVGSADVGITKGLIAQNFLNLQSLAGEFEPDWNIVINPVLPEPA